MTDSRVALGVDRLPWLTDETPARRDKRSPSMLGWTVAALLVVAGSAYWLGLETADEVETAVQPAAQPTVVAPLPELRPAQPPQPEVQVAPPPEVRPAPVREVRSAAPPVSRTAVRKSGRRVLRRESPSRKELSRTLAEQGSKTPPTATATASRPAAAQPRSLTPWPARQSAGASGRLVQIGAFGTRLQAKRGWAYMARAYPGVRRLQAVVVETRNSRGRRFYRFQIGTTSQAHSEVLCQRMRKIRFSCAVVGLPGRAKVER
jgi:hypothetical protein